MILHKNHEYLFYFDLILARKILREAKPREAGLSECGGGCGDSLSPQIPFPRRSRRCYDLSVIFDKISPSIPCFLSRLAGSEISSSFFIKGAPIGKSRALRQQRPFV